MTIDIDSVKARLIPCTCGIDRSGDGCKPGLTVTYHLPACARVIAGIAKNIYDGVTVTATMPPDVRSHSDDR